MPVERGVHSGKLRAEQTAQLLVREIGGEPSVEARPGLAPNDPVVPVAQWLRAETEHQSLAVLFGSTAAVINELFQELSAIASHDYARALTGYAASNIIRQMKHCTRGASLRAHGRSDGTEQNRCQIDHIFRRIRS